jgi:hypothetical protein
MPNGNGYSVIFNAVSVTAQQDLFEVTAGTGKPFDLLGLILTQSSEVGDAQEEGLNILIKTGATTTGTGGTTPTAIPRSLGSTAFGGTPKVNNTTKATAGTIVTNDVINWNVRVPLVLFWTPESWLTCTGGARMTIELATTPADVIVMSGTIYLHEMG